MSSNRAKTKLCTFYAKGHCNKGDDCTYIHESRESSRGSRDDRKRAVCKHFTNWTGCVRKDCTFYHPTKDCQYGAKCKNKKECNFKHVRSHVNDNAIKALEDAKNEKFADAIKFLKDAKEHDRKEFIAKQSVSREEKDLELINKHLKETNDMIAKLKLDEPKEDLMDRVKREGDGCVKKKIADFEQSVKEKDKKKDESKTN